MNWWLVLPPMLVGVIFVVAFFYPIVAALCAADWQQDEGFPEVAERELPPLTLLRPIKSGVPDLSEKLVQLAKAMHAGDQLVLGVNADSAEAAEAEKLRAKFPSHAISVIPCPPVTDINPKIAKLLQMDAAVTGEHLLLSDAEAWIDREWLDSFRREWAASGADVMTCGYRFVRIGSWPQTLDAAPAHFSLWPGLLLVRRFARLNFTLGACTAIRRSDLAKIGGWRIFAEELAEDHRLGRALVNAGCRIRLSRHVATLDSDPLTWRDYWRHQRRIAITYRVANPAGFAGMILTHPVLPGLLAIAFTPQRGAWLLCLIALSAHRWVWFRRVATFTQSSLPRSFGAMVVADIVQSICWALAWISTGVWWAGKRWRLSPDGKLRVP